MSKKTEEMTDAIVPESGSIPTAYADPKEFGQKGKKGGPRTAVQDNIGWNQTHSTDENTEGDGGPTKVGGHIAKRST